MKLLIVTQVVDTNHSNLGFFVRWIEEFAKHCDEVTVIANEVGRYTLPKNVTVYGLGKEYGSARIKRYVKFLALILWFTRSYDAVFCHMNPEFVLAGASWWRILRKPTALWYVHGTVSKRLHAALAMVDIAFTTNKESLRVLSPKVRIVGHGIDIQQFVPGTRVRHEKKKIVIAGRIARSKRPDLLARALARVAKRIPIEVECMGGPMTDDDRVYQKEFEQVIKDMDFFTYVGPKSNEYVQTVEATADVFVNASLTHSLDKALLEPMACGVIPVTTNQSFKSILEPYGLWLADDSEEAIARKVEEVCARKDFESLRPQMRDIIVKDHSLTNLIPKIVSGISEKI